MNVFTYGSLMFLDVWDSVAGGSLSSRRASLSGWQVRALEGQPWPGLVPAGPAQVAHGILHEGVEPRQLAALDAFEGPDYVREAVTVQDAAGTACQAWVYRLAPDCSLRVLDRDWRAEQLPGQTAGLADWPVPERGWWLMKSEPGEVSVAHLAAAPGQRLGWFGVRNYQARNYMRDQMKPGDLAFFYHSSCPEPGIAGLVRIAGPAYPDPTQFNPASAYFDPKASPDQPRWHQVDVVLARQVPLLSLERIRRTPSLAGLRLLQRGNRLSITPLDRAEWLGLEALVLEGETKGG